MSSPTRITKTPIGGRSRHPAPRPIRAWRRVERRFDAALQGRFGGLALALVVVGFLVVLSLGPPAPADFGFLRQAKDMPARAIAAVRPRSQPAAPAPPVAACPDAAQVEAQAGVPVFLFERPCGYHWSGAEALVRCPQGFACTFDVGSRVEVMNGTGQAVQIVRDGTWRFIAAYATDSPVRDRCALLQFERDLAQTSDPALVIEPAGFRCD